MTNSEKKETDIICENLSKKLNSSVEFNGKHFIASDGKKYTKEGYKIIAENVPIIFNSCSLEVKE